MAQTGYTPILIYSSSTSSNAPAAGNLTNSTLGSELAINITDGKLFYKDNANAVQVIAWKTTPTTAGGTGLTSYTAGDLLYYATGTTLTKLAIGASGRWLGSSGTAPQWNAPAALTKTDDTNVTLTLGGSASTALLNAASLTLGWTGQLATTRGGTGLSSFTANGIVYASSTSALATGSAITFDGTNFATTGSATATRFIPSGSTVATNGMYLPAANSLGFSTNSINAMYINSSQQTILGATTTSTQAKLEVAFDQALTTLGESRRLILNDLRGGTNERTEIGFGYVSSTTQPAVIGYQTTSNTASTKGILYFATRDVTTSTAPTERMRIHTTGGVSIGNTTDPGATNLSVTGQVSATNAITGIRNNITSTDRISVTGATTIFSIATGGSSVGASGAVLLVNGYNTASNTNSFIDLVLFIGSNTPTVLGSVNRGSPAARTYTASGSNLQLAMASGTYNVASSSTEQAC